MSNESKHAAECSVPDGGMSRLYACKYAYALHVLSA